MLPLSDESVKPYFSWLALNLSTNTSATLPIVETTAATEQVSARDTLPTGKPPTQSVGAEGIASAIFGQRTSVATDASRVRLAEVATVFSALTSLEPREQAEVVNRAGLRAGQIMDSASAADLLERSKRWLTERESSASAGGADRKAVLLRGLQYLAPHLAPEDAASFWALVQDAVKLPELPNELVTDPPTAALYADVRAALGQDQRFDPDIPYRMRERFAGHREADEPIPGFVRVPPGKFVYGHRSQEDNPPREVEIDSTFYVARTLTTVAQYARFVAAAGYLPDEAIWGRSGMEWLKRARSSPPNAAPDQWSEQIKHQHRPVTNITWFEARAYTRWLSGKIRAALDDDILIGYEARLPTELQWERAARAHNLNEAHTRRRPWGDDDSTVAQRANVDSTKIGHASTTGVFAPSAIGLYDMAGNAWEWMDNRATPGRGEPFKRISTIDRWGDDKYPGGVLRGGSWSDPPGFASCSSRLWSIPENSMNGIGVRVVFSLV